MAEYIERESALYEAEKYACSKGCVSGRHSGIADIIADNILKIPAADVRPVVHGHWDIGYFHDRVCSCCLHPDNDLNDYAHDFCPNCGAKMDGGKNNEID